MTARLVLEDTVAIASAAVSQRYCTCSLSLKVTGTRSGSFKAKACSRLRVTPGAYFLPNAGRIS